MHPTTQLAHARLRRAQAQLQADRARTRSQLVAARRAQHLAALTGTLRATLARPSAPEPICCPA